MFHCCHFPLSSHRDQIRQSMSDTKLRLGEALTPFGRKLGAAASSTKQQLGSAVGTTRAELGMQLERLFIHVLYLLNGG